MMNRELKDRLSADLKSYVNEISRYRDKLLSLDVDQGNSLFRGIIASIDNIIKHHEDALINVENDSFNLYLFDKKMDELKDEFRFYGNKIQGMLSPWDKARAFIKSKFDHGEE
jgi:hypothetical protein